MAIFLGYQACDFDVIDVVETDKVNYYCQCVFIWIKAVFVKFENIESYCEITVLITVNSILAMYHTCSK